MVYFVDVVLVLLLVVVLAGAPRSGSASSFCGGSYSRGGGSNGRW